jgi:hemerythrin-like domain-containing protein
MVPMREDRVTHLKNQHDAVRHRLELMRNSIERTPRPPPRALARSVERLESLVEAHMVDEESSLYEPMKRRLGRDNPIDEMAREHRSIRQGLSQLHSVSVEYSDDPSRIGDVKSHLKSLEEKIGEHMNREEGVLFWLADLKL